MVFMLALYNVLYMVRVYVVDASSNTVIRNHCYVGIRIMFYKAVIKVAFRCLEYVSITSSFNNFSCKYPYIIDKFISMISGLLFGLLQRLKINRFTVLFIF